MLGLSSRTTLEKFPSRRNSDEFTRPLLLLEPILGGVTFRGDIRGRNDIGRSSDPLSQLRIFCISFHRSGGKACGLDDRTLRGRASRCTQEMQRRSELNKVIQAADMDTYKSCFRTH